MSEKRFLAFDLGAESGRAIVGTLRGEQLDLEEIHRWPNGPVDVRGALYWDVLRLYSEMIESLRAYVSRYGDTLDGIGIDTWAVDFGLLDEYGMLLENPACYRDRRTQGMDALALKRFSARELFQVTGMELIAIQTLCQLLALQQQRPAVLERAARLLMMPGLFTYFLCGALHCEHTAAGMSQLYDVRAQTWSDEILSRFNIPRELFPDLVRPGTMLGELSEGVKAATGLRHAPVIAPCTHDTASAAAAAPAIGRDDWAFLSSGTWSILGVPIDAPCTTEEAFSSRLSNEQTSDGLMLCRNIMGLWLLQQTRAAWQRTGETYGYEQLASMAQQAPEGGPLVHADDPSFLAPADMAQAVANYCRRTGQPVPDSVPATVRCIFESLALSYRHGIEVLERATSRKVAVIHVVGGGARNALLCQMTADATGRPVAAGPADATAVGNLLVQTFATGLLDQAATIRQTVRRTSAIREYVPSGHAYWQDRYGRYIELLDR
jgi:rhamnulokinase